MPNYVKNRLRVHPNNWQALKNLLLDADGDVDFNKVIPMPDTVYQGELFCHPGGNFKTPAGYADNWYDWAQREWGTKWNATFAKLDEELHEISFETAWNHPQPVIDELARRAGFPIHVAYADEDLGRNLGAYIIHGDKRKLSWLPADEYELENLACHIHHKESISQWRSDDEDYAGDDYPQCAETYELWEHLRLDNPAA